MLTDQKLKKKLKHSDIDVYFPKKKKNQKTLIIENSEVQRNSTAFINF